MAALPESPGSTARGLPDPDPWLKTHVTAKQKAHAADFTGSTLITEHATTNIPQGSTATSPQQPPGKALV